MKIYNYDSETKIYLSSQNADLDPEETKIQGKDVYLIPDNATTTKPPAAKENSVRVWDENKWIYVADYRQNYYKVDSNLNVFTIDKIGEIEQGYILVEKETGNLIKENPEDYIIDNDSIREKTAEEKQAEERLRLDALTLTPADVERALYKERQMDFEDLKTLIAEELPQVDIKAISIEFRAKDFYRGAEAAGMRLFDVVGGLLGYTTEDMDYLFQNKELPEGK